MTNYPSGAYYRETLLARLRRLLELRKQYAADMNDEGYVLMQRCINATYGDCLDAHCAAEAGRVLREATK